MHKEGPPVLGSMTSETTRSALKLWLSLAGVTVSISLLTSGTVGIGGLMFAVSLFFCGTSGAWMAFGGGPADRSSAWLTMVLWGVLLQIGAPLAAVRFWWASEETALWGVVVASAASSGVLGYATRSWRSAAGPLVGAGLVVAASRVNNSLADWTSAALSMSVWMAATSSFLAWWACGAVMRQDLVRRGAMCGSCGYNFAGLKGVACPECGEPGGWVPVPFSK